MYATSRTFASEPITAAPFDAITGVSKQKTPIGESFRIISIHFIKISFQRFMVAIAPSTFSPKRIIAKPMSNAITMIWSMFALEIGTRKFDGNILTNVSRAVVDFGGVYVRLDVERAGNEPLKTVATVSPIETATAVVQK